VRIEDDALVADLRSAAFVGRDGSVDRLCPPRLMPVTAGDGSARDAPLAMGAAAGG
jgi:hypothetical protein